MPPYGGLNAKPRSTNVVIHYNYFFLLSFQYKMRFPLSILEPGMTPFAKAAATLAACIGAFTVVVCIVEGLAG